MNGGYFLYRSDKAAVLAPNLPCRRAEKPLHREAKVVAGELCYLSELDDRADGKNVVVGYLVLFGKFLGADEQPRIRVGCGFNRRERHYSAHVETYCRVREYYSAPQCEQRIILKLRHKKSSYTEIPPLRGELL